MSEKNTPPAEPLPRQPTRRRRPARSRLLPRLLAMVAESFPKLTSLLKLARDWTRRKPLWVRVPLYLGLAVGGLVYAFSDALLKLPALEDFRGGLVEYAKDAFAVGIPKASGKGFAIALVRLDDDDGKVGKLLGEALRIPGVERLQIDRRLQFVDAGNLDAAEAEAHQTVRRWLEISQADLIIWGQVIPTKPERVRLIMTPRHARLEREAELASRNQAFTFTDVAREPFEAAVLAQVNGYLAQFDASRVLVTPLREAVTRLEAVVRGRPSSEGRAALVFALANARATLGEQAGDAAVLEAAVTDYREVLTARQRDRVPLDWAMTQSNLGSALASLARREAGSQKWTEAIAAYRLALEEYSVARTPLEWAWGQNNLGLALENLGEREGKVARIEEAVSAFRSALTKVPGRAPESAMIRNNLGNALVALGEHEDNPARLIEATEEFRAALKVRTRKAAPLSWATTQSNLGNALAALGERETGTARFAAAVDAYREALREFAREKLPLDWARTQNNLGTALGAWGEREANVARLREADTTLRDALEVRRRETLPLAWAATQRNRGTVLRFMGERETGTARLVEAVALYRSALEEFSPERTPLEWAMTHSALGDTLRALGEREGSVARIEEALRLFDLALAVPEIKAAPTLRNSCRAHRWKAEAALGKLAPHRAP